MSRQGTRGANPAAPFDIRQAAQRVQQGVFSEDNGVFAGIDLTGFLHMKRWQGELQKAKDASFLQRCVKKTLAEKGKYTSPETGLSIDAERFPMCGRSSTELREYGCSVAVNLFLRFNLEAALLFLLMFLVSIYQVYDSWERNTLRQECREAIPSNYDAIIAGSWNSSLAQSCGYQGLTFGDGAPAFVRRNLSELNVNLLMRFSLGACEEYTNQSDQVLFSPASDVSNGRPLAATPEADFCLSDSDGLVYWLSALNVILSVLFLVRLRRLQFVAANKDDKAMWTAADYSVLVKGLIKGGVAHEEHGTHSVESKLWEDLIKLGFHKEYIDHIELGVDCADEIEIARKVERLEVRKEELLAREKSRQAKGQPAQTEKTQEKVVQIDDDLAALKEELQQLQSKEHITTGHAFIVFKYELHRNHLFKLFHRTFGQRMALRTPFAASLGVQELPGLTAAAGANTVSLESAPEPSDVFWENLAKDEAYTRRASLITSVVSSLLVGLSVGIQILIKVAQESYTPDKLIEENGIELSDRAASVYTLSLSAVASTVVVVINLLLKLSIKYFVAAEGHDTKTDFERRVFTMCSMAYVFNTVILPMVMGAVPFGVTQAWYESGGVVTQAAFLIVTNVIFVEGLKVLQLYPLTMRYLVAPFVISQKRKNELWAPPRMLLGDLYAGSIKTVALGLLYAPLFPLAYLLTSAAFVISFWATKFAIVFWYHKPPSVDQDMMDRMRTILSFCLLGQLLSMLIAGGKVNSADGGSVFDTGTGWAAFVVALVVWLLYQCIPLGFIPCLQDFDQLGDTDAEDTDSIPYDQVTQIKHYEIERYVCPAARRGRSIDVCLRSSRDGNPPSWLHAQPELAHASASAVNPLETTYPSASAGIYPPTTFYPPRPTAPPGEPQVQQQSNNTYLQVEV